MEGELSVDKEMEVCYHEGNVALDDYLEASEYIDWKDIRIQEKAKEYMQKYTDEAALVKALFEFVRDAIGHSWDVQDRRVTRSASETLEQGVGICWAKSNLLAALLRACHIPAGICYQRLTFGAREENRFCIHALNAVYIRSRKKWIRLDARGNKPGVDAQFDLDREKLAFAVHPERGELDYPMIFAKPSAGLMQILEENTDALYMYRNCLPEELPEEDAVI